MSDDSPRGLLLCCRHRGEVERMREYAQKHLIGDNVVRGSFMTLSADCLRYIEALEKAGIHANNIEKVTVPSI